MTGVDELLGTYGDVSAYRRGANLIYKVTGHLLVDHPDDGQPAVRIPEKPTRYLTALEAEDLDQLRALIEAPSTNGHVEAPGPRLSHRKASTIQVVPPVWLWRRWLVAGAVQLLVGRQGSGKSTFAAWTVAQLTSGRPWPDETEHRPPLRCGMLSLEEPGGERLAARLVAIGANLDEVHILGDVEDLDEGGPYRRPWRLPGDCAALETVIREQRFSAVTIDGLGHSIAGDSHNYANVGSALSALAAVAERTGCAILGLTHPPKGNSDAVTSAIGSTAWTAVARISWVMGLDPTDDEPDPNKRRRVVRPAPGSNYRLPETGLSFKIAEHDETEAGFVTGIQASDVDPADITSPPLPETPEERSKRQIARDFLTDRLAICDHLSKPLFKDAQEGHDISEKTLRRAGVDLKIVAYQMGREWWWKLPSDGQVASDG